MTTVTLSHTIRMTILQLRCDYRIWQLRVAKSNHKQTEFIVGKKVCSVSTKSIFFYAVIAVVFFVGINFIKAENDCYKSRCHTSGK